MEASNVPRVRRKRSTVIVRKEGREVDGDVGLSATDPIERLVAEARERVFLMSRKSGGGVAQTSVLGRLAATGEISRRQYEAGARYATIVREHDALLAHRTARPTAVSDAAPDEVDDDRVRYRSVMARYDRCRSSLRDAGREDLIAAAVVDAVAVSNWDLPDLTPALRIGLNHLARTLELMDGEATDVRGRRSG